MWSWLAGVAFLLGAAPAPQDAPEAANATSDYILASPDDHPFKVEQK